MTNILSWAISILETTPERVSRLMQALPEELSRRPAAPGEWSAVECLHHLIVVENLYAKRVEAFLTGQPSFPVFNPEAPENRPAPGVLPNELAEEFARRRSANLKKAQELKEADLERISRHAELGPVTLDQMMHTWAAHDLNHVIQAERALMQPFLAGCGPWIKFLKDNLIEQAEGGEA